MLRYLLKCRTAVTASSGFYFEINLQAVPSQQWGTSDRRDARNIVILAAAHLIISSITIFGRDNYCNINI